MNLPRSTFTADDERILASYVTRDQRLADLRTDIINWPWTEREDNDDKDSDAPPALPVWPDV